MVRLYEFEIGMWDMDTWMYLPTNDLLFHLSVLPFFPHIIIFSLKPTVFCFLCIFLPPFFDFHISIWNSKSQARFVEVPQHLPLLIVSAFYQTQKTFLLVIRSCSVRQTYIEDVTPSTPHIYELIIK